MGVIDSNKVAVFIGLCRLGLGIFDGSGVRLLVGISIKLYVGAVVRSCAGAYIIGDYVGVIVGPMLATFVGDFDDQDYNFLGITDEISD